MEDEKLLEYEAPKYKPPKVITLDKDEILEEMGPARACQYYDAGSPCPAFSP